MPKFEEISDGFRVTVYNKVPQASIMENTRVNTQVTEQVPEQVNAQVTAQVTAQVDDSVLKLVSFCVEPKSRQELMAHLKIKHREYFRSTLLAKALEHKLIEPTIPDKPRSRFQKYRLTAKGKKILGNGDGKQ